MVSYFLLNPVQGSGVSLDLCTTAENKWSFSAMGGLILSCGANMKELIGFVNNWHFYHVEWPMNQAID